MAVFEKTRKVAPPVGKAVMPLLRRAPTVAELARRNGRGKLTSKPDELAVAVGRGLIAGAIGTAAMTASSTIEGKLRGRGESTAPADAVEKVAGIEPKSEQAEARLSNVAHWFYGTSWGALRGLLGLAGFDAAKATAIHGTAVWVSGMVMLPALRISPPPWKWGPTELAIDAFHHAVYAGATGAAYEALER